MSEKERELLEQIQNEKDRIYTLYARIVDLENELSEVRQRIALEIVNSYKKALDEKKNNTYNITINTHGCDNKSPEELAEKFIKGIKEKGANL
jgi:uncharacterized protein YlxW (UPF0749 family)